MKSRPVTRAADMPLASGQLSVFSRPLAQDAMRSAGDAACALTADAAKL